MSYNKKLEDRVDHFFIDDESLEKKNQMGGVGWLINGNMCFGIYDDLLVVRLEPSIARSLVAKKGVAPFEQNEDDLEGFISLESVIYKNNKAFRKFLTHSYNFTSGLPPKKHDQENTDLSL